MKTTRILLFSLALFTSKISFTQIKERAPFLSGTLSTTFGLNQNYKLDEEDNGPLIVPKSILLRTEFGYQFNNRWASSINFGYDHHFIYAINAIPYYGSVRYNFISKNSEVYFIETSYGQLWRPSQKFSNGNYYKIGIGIMSVSDERWNGSIRLDFHRKKIADFENGNLDSLSLGLGFNFF